MINKLLVLSGGGCRGFAHLGVMKALNEHDIYASEIAGTSAGALAGAFLANGFQPDEIMEMFTDKSKINFFSWNAFKPGLMSMKHIKEFLQKNLRFTKFEDCPIPFYATATNFINGRQTIFHKGDIIGVIVAASSIPVLFPPVIIDNIPYVDGGLSNNLPVEPFGKRKKEEIIAVYVNPINPFNSKEGTMEVLDRSIHLSFRGMVERSAEACYLYIEPGELSKFGLFDMHKMNEIFETGYYFTKQLLQNNETRDGIIFNRPL
jgi:NTE family protein